ncbi:hypothetical protein [Lyngbya confervoides]|uniref:Uncharacterized protein n=1 Tax=Lyngbya confervoides BDU141951 TaxID=1574623 RepID=A0ABD4T501_9CYAN|nr:hypothetical protein [Lyngbya confervoides]MCM1983599.1 hypothetical protein [Lyngbya confervoides BDU141951]
MSQFALAMEHSTPNAHGESQRTVRDAPREESLDITENITEEIIEITPSSRPRLRGVLNLYGDQILCFKNGVTYPLHELSIPTRRFIKLLICLEGTSSVQELEDNFFPDQPGALITLLRQLALLGLVELIKDERPKDSAQSLLVRLQQQMAKIPLSKQIESILRRSPQQQQAIVQGCILQHLHLVALQSEFVYPLLGQSGNDAWKEYMQRLYLHFVQQMPMIRASLADFNLQPEALHNNLPLPYTSAIQNNLIYSASAHSIQGLLNLCLWQTFMAQSLQHYHQTFGELLSQSSSRRLTQIVDEMTLPQGLRYCFEALPPLNFEQAQALRGRSHVLIEMCEQFNPSAIAYYQEKSLEMREFPFIFDGGLVQ